MKKEIQKIVRDYVKKNPVPKIKEDSLKNPNSLSMLELRNTDEGKEMLKDISAFMKANQSLYTIGQASLLPEQFHQLLIYGAVAQYYSSIKPETTQAQLYTGMYTAGLLQLQKEHGQAVSDPALEDIDDREIQKGKENGKRRQKKGISS